MYSIVEKPSNKLACRTSLYLNTSGLTKSAFDAIIQTPNTFYDNKLFEFEMPVNRLFYIVSILMKSGSVKFTRYKPAVLSTKKCDVAKFKVKPYSYQLDGINFGLAHNSWLLLDDQGLGKTLQMIYLAETLKRTEKIKHCLIVCGVNSLKYNWASEIEKFSSLDYCILGQSFTRTGKVKIASVQKRCELLKNGISEFFVITNIETLQNKDFVTAYTKGKTKFDMIVVDEAHRCNNPTAKSVKNLLRLKADRKIALTGTIIMNTPENSFVPLKWTDNVHSTFTDFKHMYNVYGGFGNVQVIGYKNLELLKELIASCSLRRLKTDVLDLPDRSFAFEYVDMYSDQQDLYDTVADGIATELNLLPNRPTILQELAINIRLRQITAYPGMLSSEVTRSAKLDRLSELVEDICAQGDKVVVFNTFKDATYEEMRRLSDYNPVVCTGDQSDYEITENKKKFETDSNVKLMLCTWQKMGIGHTLTSANYVIFVDTPWTDADFRQCADRIYRIGQDKKCFIITLITKGSYDERVQQILERKEVLGSYLTGTAGGILDDTVESLTALR